MGRRRRRKNSTMITQGSIVSKRQFIDSSIDNIDMSTLYHDKLTELALSVFDWQGLPEEIDVRFLEQCLFTTGSAIFFYDSDLMKYVCLPGVQQGKPDIYGNPIKVNAIASNGYHYEGLTNGKDCVVIYNNYLKKPSLLEMRVYAERLAKIDITMDINVEAQKTPILITCPENQRLTMKNLYMQYSGGAPFIFGDDSLNPNALKVLNTGAPYIAQQLLTLKTNVWNEALTHLGISNVNITKKERLITDEVLRNLGGIMANRFSKVEMRRIACEKINKIFGLNVSCQFREDFANVLANDSFNSEEVPDEDSTHTEG